MELTFKMEDLIVTVANTPVAVRQEYAIVISLVRIQRLKELLLLSQPSPFLLRLIELWFSQVALSDKSFF